MTVCLAYVDKSTGKSWMGGDSCASDPINHSTVSNNKVFHPVGRRDILIGCAGTFRLPNLLQYVPGVFPGEDEIATNDIDMSFIVNEFVPVVKALTDDFGEDDMWELLLAVGDHIYRVQMDYSVVEPADDSDAIGIGGSVALGAFKVLNELASDKSVEDRIKHALQVACDSCQGCMPPFKIMCTEEIPKEILDKIPDKRENQGYEIIRCDLNDGDKSQKKKKNSKSKKRISVK